MNKTQVVVLPVIVNKENKILLTFRNEPEHPEIHDMWQLPGGGLEFGEHPEETAIREAKEEVGIGIKIKKLIPFFEMKIESSWHGIFISYLAEPLSDEVVINEEASKFGWFTIDEIEKMDQEKTILPKTFSIIEHIANDLQS